MTISLRSQIQEVEYELGQRRNVYGRLVASKKMRESVAQMHLDRMDAVRRTLNWLHANEAAIRAAVPSKKEERS